MSGDLFVGPLPGATRRTLEWLFGANLARVSIHVSDLPERLGVRGFASGEHVWIQDRCWHPGSPEGLLLLAHEVAHVLQQRLLDRCVGASAVLVRDAAREHEASRLGRAAAALVCREGVHGAARLRLRGVSALRGLPVPIEASGAIHRALKGAGWGVTGVIQCDPPDTGPNPSLATPNDGSVTFRIRDDGRIEIVAGLPEVAGQDLAVGARRGPGGKWQIVVGPYPADPGSDLYTFPELLDLIRGIGAGRSGAPSTGGLPPIRFPNPMSPPTFPNPSLPPWLATPQLPGSPGLSAPPRLFPDSEPRWQLQLDPLLSQPPIPGVLPPFVLPPLTLPPLDGNAHLVVLDGFFTGQSNVPGVYIPTLDQAASSIRAASPPPMVLIQGHTDAIGPEPFNETLGLRRAQAVRDALLARRLDTGQLVVSSAGESSPVADNTTPDGRARNRRVEIFWTTERFRLPLTP